VTSELAPVRRGLLLIGGGALLLAFAAYVLHAATDFGGATTATLFDTWVYDALMLGAAGSCFLRAALVRRERLAWALLGLGLAIWTGGEIYYEAVSASTGSVPVPSPADAGYLLFYPLAYAGLIVLLRERIGSFPVARWLDGLVAGTAVAAVAAAVVLGPIVDHSTSGSNAEVITDLAYPVADLALLTLVVTAAAFTGWRPGSSWSILGLGLLFLGGSDVAYLLQSAQGTYVEGGLLDAAWPAGALLLAGAAWVAPGRRLPHSRDARLAAVPAAAALAAIGVQASERFTPIPATASVLSLVTLMLVVVRFALALRESQADLETTTQEALTDALTGLANRRALMEDLAAAVVTPPAAGHQRLLAIFDLDGFKAYNDAYGHPAGDALLARLGGRLQAFAAAGGGGAYRLGGDEFCLLTECTAAAVDGIVGGGGAALSEHGDGFLVTASQGSVLIPSEARTREGALQLADRRMYANKSRERASAGSQSRDVLLSALRERQPELAEHLVGTAALALAVAEELGMDSEQRDEVRRAAELHDTGKVAIPDAILRKAGPLDDAEWEFMRRHTLIGERIIASAPALVPVARLVRSTHERWDGRGYPDQLVGEQIPLGSRVVAVCDAYEAMTSERPYSVAMLPERALEELHRGAGSQFDAEVVEAFERVIATRGAVRT
jgi:diguanylate cyclase (GGDEF)-like protein